MAKSILDDALADAKLIQNTAFENARNVLVERISPQIKEFVDSYIADDKDINDISTELMELSPEEVHNLLSVIKQHVGDITQGGDDATQGFNNKEEDENMSTEAMYEEQDVDAEDKKEDEEEKELDEVVTIDHKALKQAWNEIVREAMIAEGDVPSPETKASFDEPEDPNLGSDERGLADKEKEEMWKDHEPPAASDWTVKENNYKNKIKALESKLAEASTVNKSLGEAAQKLKRSLSEMNVFNAKLLHTNKLLQETESLTNEQRLTVIESFDDAKTVREVEFVYKSLSEAFKIAGVLSESRKNKQPKSSRFTTSSTAKMLNEQADKAAKEAGADDQNEVFARMQKLAGIVQ